MNISSEIEQFILSVLGSGDEITLSRNELAQYFSVAPSQINYVLMTRFTPARGYVIESRRGGGGYIKITRASYNYETLKMHLVNSIGDAVDEQTCRANLENLCQSGVLTQKEARLIYAALREPVYRDVPKELRGRLRAAIFKQMLLVTMQ